MRYQTCCFTGHREIPKLEYDIIKERLEDEVIKLIHQGVRYFGAGGARGFDTMAALTVLKFREIYPHIRLILVLPCKNQVRGWDVKDIDLYCEIYKKADKVVCLSDTYYNGCMIARNRHLVDHNIICVCYLTKHNGGTAFTVDYATRSGLKVINIDSRPRPRTPQSTSQLRHPFRTSQA